MRLGLTVRGLIVLVAFAGVALAAFRLQPAIGCLVASVLGLAFIRTSGRIDRRRATDPPISTSAIIGSFLGSMVVASTILVASLIPGLCLLPMFAQGIHSRPSFDWSSSVMGLAISGLAALPIAMMLRRRLW